MISSSDFRGALLLRHHLPRSICPCGRSLSVNPLLETSWRTLNLELMLKRTTSESCVSAR
uniref:Uncharacterized protein n=1 Tax=Arundo donax TaxID=35708 RepID=A0A0A8YK49_ARUDO